MKKRTPVSKIMKTGVKTANLTNKISEISAMMKEHGIHHVPVVSGKKLVGMISSSDLDRISFIGNYDGGKVSTKLYDSLKIEQVMTKNIISVQSEDSILDAATILSQHEFHALPVLNGEEIAGIVSTKDLLKFMIEQF